MQLIVKGDDGCQRPGSRLGPSAAPGPACLGQVPMPAAANAGHPRATWFSPRTPKRSATRANGKGVEQGSAPTGVGYSPVTKATRMQSYKSLWRHNLKSD